MRFWGRVLACCFFVCLIAVESRKWMCNRCACFEQLKRLRLWKWHKWQVLFAINGANVENIYRRSFLCGIIVSELLYRIMPKKSNLLSCLVTIKIFEQARLRRPGIIPFVIYCWWIKRDDIMSKITQWPDVNVSDTEKHTVLFEFSLTDILSSRAI